MTRSGRWLVVGVLVLVGGVGTGRAVPPGSTEPVEGLRDNTPAVHALLDGRIVTGPGQVVEQGTVVIRDGVIVAVGADVEVPAEARRWELAGKTVYPGLIDSYGEIELDRPDGQAGTPHWNPEVHPQLQAAGHYQVDEELQASLRGQGITARLVAPARGVIKGTSTLVATGQTETRHAVLKPDVALHLRLTVSPGRNRDQYPNSPMGAVALARQVFHDADWYGRAWEAHRAEAGLPRPERNDALEALRDYAGSDKLVMADAADERFFLRADRFAREFGLRLAVRGSGHEYRQLEAIAGTGRPVIVPVEFPRPPYVADPDAALSVPLEELLHWDFAPENLQRLEAAGVRFALTSHGLEDRQTFLAAVRRAVERGLSAEAALEALTTAPAALFAVEELLGTLQAGKLANLVVTDGELFDSDTRVLETWVLGRRYEIEETPPLDVRGTWQVTLTEQSDPADQPPPPRQAVIELSGRPAQLTGTIRPAEAGADEPQPEALELDHLHLHEARVHATFDGGPFGRDQTARLSAVTSVSPEGDQHWQGRVVWSDGSRSQLSGRRTDLPVDGPDGQGGDDAVRQVEAKASFPLHYPLGAFGRREPPEQPGHVLLQNATLWTCGEQGVLENASLLIGGGRILAVGPDLDAPPEATVIDARGKHITPGLIDCHSHIATDGGINESTRAITAEVRIEDFLDPRDIAIYRQLAGGVTVANLLHGSANPIGGQNQVIKLRWGGLDDALKLDQAPAGIKFALGENVKQSNWGDRYTGRYPQTRMGVQQIIGDALQAARDYRQRWDRWEETAEGLPPRRDLALEALAEVLEGRRWIHCHCYRQDEILALIRTLDRFDIQIGTFQHVLEGYKVADALARHGAMVSAFSDWWAFKFEAYDAIPYNAALMHQAGVVVSFNSDHPELGRRLNQEAAKAVKYGGLPPEEALKYVTLNPARQLRIEQHVGSLEVDKHADLVVWSGPPLSSLSRCEQTWIDGRLYFDLDQDRQQRQQARQMRAALVQKVLDSGEKMRRPGEPQEDSDDHWPREDQFCHPHW